MKLKDRGDLALWKEAFLASLAGGQDCGVAEEQAEKYVYLAIKIHEKIPKPKATPTPFPPRPLNPAVSKAAWWNLWLA